MHAAGMPWKPRKQYALKRVQSIVTEKFKHMKIKKPQMAIMSWVA